MDLKIRLSTSKSYEDKSQGFCHICRNFSLKLGDINICPACDAESEKRIARTPEKSYIKAGKRHRVGL